MRIVREPHDFGGYYEVVCEYDGNRRDAAEYAMKCEEQAPKYWPEKFVLQSAVRFQAGATMVATPKQLAALVARHQRGDWGDISTEDKIANDKAVQWGDRILSSYKQGDQTLWVLTEADRSSTTVLTPGEY